MALAGSLALLVLMVASGVGWWSGRRLATAANLEMLRRRGRSSLVAGVVVVAAGTVHVGIGMLQGQIGDPTWAGPALAALVGIPVLTTLVLTLPRTWVVVRRRRSADPLHWPDGRLRVEVAGPELVVPFAASLLGAVAVVLLPSAAAAPSAVQVAITALAVTVATAVIDARQRRLRARVASPLDLAALSWPRVADRSAATR